MEPHTALAELQARAGNAAVTQLLQRQVPVAPVDPQAAPAPAPAAPSVEAPPAGDVGPRRLLRFGSKGDEVFELQSRLNRAPEVSVHLAVDGHYGPQTTAAVRDFQKAHPPLKVDGIVGPLTRAELDKIPADTSGHGKEHAEKLFERANVEYSAGRFAHAYDFFSRSQEHFHTDAMYFNRAQALRRLGARREEAIALYEKYIATGHAGRKADAVAFLAELRGPGTTGDEATDKKAAEALFEKANDLYSAGRYAQAYDEFTKSQQVFHTDAMYFNRAQALRKLGARREEAIALYEKYIATGHAGRKADAQLWLDELRHSGAAP